jgi:hypothetical protein
VFRDNLYWSHEASDMAGPIFPEMKDWTAWSRGNDTNSQWTTAPLFRCTSLTDSTAWCCRDPGAGDYTLVAGSPAAGLGIRQIDTSTKGPRP